MSGEAWNRLWGFLLVLWALAPNTASPGMPGWVEVIASAVVLSAGVLNLAAGVRR